MKGPSWRDRLDEFWHLLLFLGRLPDETRKGEDKRSWERELRRELGARDDATLDAFAARWQARYDEIEATRGTITTRTNSLLLFVGVLITGAGLIAQSIAGAPGPFVLLLVLVGIPLLYSGVAAAVLAVRAQRVGRWDSPRVDVVDAANERSVRLQYAVEIYVAAEQNRLRLRAPVGMLRDGQLYAILGIALVAAIVALSVSATLVKPTGSVIGPLASPAPSASSAAPTPTPSIVPLPTSTLALPASPSVRVTAAPSISPS